MSDRNLAMPRRMVESPCNQTRRGTASSAFLATCILQSFWKEHDCGCRERKRKYCRKYCSFGAGNVVYFQSFQYLCDVNAWFAWQSELLAWNPYSWRVISSPAGLVRIRHRYPGNMTSDAQHGCGGAWAMYNYPTRVSWCRGAPCHSPPG